MTADLSHNTRDQWEIDRNSLKFIKKLGHGQFGEVSVIIIIIIVTIIIIVIIFRCGRGSGTTPRQSPSRRSSQVRIRGSALDAAFLTNYTFGYLKTEFVFVEDVKWMCQ